MSPSPSRVHAARLAATLLPLLLAACGGHGDRPADVVPSTAFPAPLAVAGPDRFLLWPNPLATPDGTPPKVDSAEYAEAYYRAIDEHDERLSLDAWKAVNGFGKSGGIEASAVFADVRDLGYGRRMTGRCDADPVDPTRCAKTGRIAFVVENFLVNPGAEGYGARVNLDAAVVDDRQWRVSVNAIEFSAGPSGTVRYAKFFSFDPATGQRKPMQDLDGRGPKALPGVCTSCHGGRVDALEPSGDPAHPWRMPLLNGDSADRRGDVRGRLHPFEVDALGFSAAAGASRPEQEAALKTMNRMVLCSYPYGDGVPRSLADDACRDDAEPVGWRGGAAEVIKQAYRPDMASATYQAAPVPAGWSGTAGTVVEDDLYRDVVAPACLSCHRLLGNGRQSDIDFATFAKFDGYIDRTRHLVFERGNMPLSRLVFRRFWSTDPADGGMARRLADYLAANGRPVATDAAGAPVAPGFPVAIAGPDRRVKVGATRLSTAPPLHADRLHWTLVAGPDGATPPTGARLADADTATPTFTADPAAAGRRYRVELVASRDGIDSAPASSTLYVDTPADPFPDPAAVSLADVRTLLGNNCTGSSCHSSGSTAGRAPLAFDAADDIALYDVLRSRLNFEDLSTSQLLRKPTGEHHGGLGIPGFCSRLAPGAIGCDAVVATPVAVGDPTRAGLDMLIDWAVSGTPR